MDVVRWAVSSDCDQAVDVLCDLFGSAAFWQFHTRLADHRFFIGGYAASGGRKAESAEEKLVGAAMVVLVCHETRKLVTARCVGLAILESHRGIGLGQTLFDKVHAHSFYLAQGMSARRGALTHDCQLAFEMNAGSCFRQPLALLLYVKNGARVVKDGTIAIGEEEAAELVRDSVDLGNADVTIIWDHVMLCCGYLSPRAKIPRKDAYDATDFTPPFMADTPQPWWKKVTKFKEDKRYYHHAYGINRALLMGTKLVGTKPPNWNTGCYSFIMLALPCHWLEEYLKDRSNRGQTGELIVHDKSGNEVGRLYGYNTYGWVNARKFNAREQQKKTLLATSVPELDLLGYLPGYTQVLVQVREQLSLQSFEAELRSVHILTQDDSNQASFRWHTDGFDNDISVEDEENLLTVAVQLSCSGVSCMQVPNPHSLITTLCLNCSEPL